MTWLGASFTLVVRCMQEQTLEYKRNETEERNIHL